MLNTKQYRASPLSSERRALHKSKHYQQNGSENSRGFVCRQQTDHRGGCAHDQQRCHEHKAATKAFAQISKNHATDRPRNVAHGERG